MYPFAGFLSSMVSLLLWLLTQSQSYDLRMAQVRLALLRDLQSSSCLGLLPYLRPLLGVFIKWRTFASRFDMPGTPLDSPAARGSPRQVQHACLISLLNSSPLRYTQSHSRVYDA